MPLGDRDYMRDDPQPFWSWVGGLSMTTWLIAANVAVFLLWTILGNSDPFMKAHFTVSGNGVFSHYRVWTLITASFSQNDLLHLLFNMVILYFFCPSLEKVYGAKNVLVLYLLGAVGCGLGHIALTMPLGNELTPALGASGSMLAVVTVFALLYPNRQLFLFGVLPVPAWALAVLILGIDLMGVAVTASGAVTGIAHAGHIGGAIAGAAFKLLDLRLFNRDDEDDDGFPVQRNKQGLLARWQEKRRRAQLRVLPPLKQEEKQPAPSEQDEIDADTARRVDELLVKINEEGLDSLSDEDRSFLERASLKYKR